mgnify:CR=1 FL=1
MLSLTNDMMRQIIMDHYSNPVHKHQPSNDLYQKTHMHSDNCIDDIDVFLLIENDTIKDACFDGVGCTIATSSTDIMCELLIGKSTKDALYIIEQYNHMVHEEQFDDSVLDEAIVFINTSKQAARIRCATIGWNAADMIIKGK